MNNQTIRDKNATNVFSCHKALIQFEQSKPKHVARKAEYDALIAKNCVSYAQRGLTLAVHWYEPHPHSVGHSCGWMITLDYIRDENGNKLHTATSDLECTLIEHLLPLTE